MVRLTGCRPYKQYICSYLDNQEPYSDNLVLLQEAWRALNGSLVLQLALSQ